MKLLEHFIMAQKPFSLYLALPVMLLFLNACDVRREELSGVYTIKGLKNSLDTLKLASNGTYIRTLYAKDGKRMLFKNKDRWKIDADRILLYNYLPDEDEKHMSEEILGPGAMLCYLPVEKQFGKIIIKSAHLGDDAVYEKL